MARPTSRRNLTLESLESREVLSTVAPSNQAQYMLEVLNLVRTNPSQGAQWVEDKADSDTKVNVQAYNVDLNAVVNSIASAQPRQPLAWNGDLAQAAQGQSEDMATNGFQSHTGSDGRDLGARLDAAGYTNRTRATENAFAYSKSVDNAMQAFLVDWGVAGAGHRKNILDSDTSAQDSTSEVGIGIASSTKPGFGPLVITQDFGARSNDKPQLVGVVYDDRDGDGRFSLNEGRGDATIDVTNVQNGQTKSVQTWGSGGYQIELDPGTYNVSGRIGSRSLGTKTVTITNQNVKVDFNTSAAPATNPTPAPVVVRSAAPKVTTSPTVTPTTTTSTRSSTSTTSSAPTTASKSVSAAALDAGLLDDNWAVDAGSIKWYSSWGAK